MNPIVKLLATTLFAAGITSASAAAEVAAGAYYNIPMDILKQQNAATSGTGQLLVYSRDNGTTAVQLLVEAQPDTVGFVLYREATPDEASDIFGSIDTLKISYRPMNRPTGGTDHQAFDLLQADGLPLGDTFQLFDAANKPFSNIQIKYSTREINMHSLPTTGTARVLPGGYVRIPQSPVTQQSMHSGTNYRLDATEPFTGATIENINIRTHLQTYDGITSITLPFLNDWKTTAPGLDVYSGQIFSNDGSPAANVPFTIDAMMYQDTSSQFYYDRMHHMVNAGPDGRFQFAFMQPETAAHSAIANVQLQVSSPGISQGQHTLLTSNNNVIRTPADADVTFQIVDGNGAPFDFQTSSPLKLNCDSAENGVVIEISRSRSGPTHALQFADQHSSGLKPLKLSIPGSYIAMSRGYLFGPVRINESDKVITLKPQLADFEVTGTITDTNRKGIPGALVLLIDRAATYRCFDQEINYNLLTQFRGKSFEELGAYLIETDQDGHYKLTGKSLSQNSMFYATAPGYGTIVYAPLKQSERTYMGWRGLQFPPPPQVNDIDRLSGSYDVGTQAIAREATVTLEIRKPAERESTTALYKAEPKLHVSVSADFMEKDLTPADPSFGDLNVPNKPIWHGWKTVTGEKASLNVPAETTFTLTVHTPYATAPDSKPLQIKVEKPLQPGETRDLGIIN